MVWATPGRSVLGFFGIASTESPSTAASTAVAKPLSASDLPAGFKAITPPLVPKLCSELDLPNPNERHLTVGFQTISLTILEALTVPTSVRAVYRELHQHYANCRKIAPVRGLRITGTGKELSMTQIGRVSQAFAFALSVHGTHLNEDLVVFRTPFSCGVVEFLSESPLKLEQFEFVASIAAAKANSVVSVPTIATSAPSHSS